MRSQLLFRFVLASCLAVTAYVAPAHTAPPLVTVSVSPSSDVVPFSSTRQFTATVNGAAITTVTWSVNDIPGGNTTLGTISSSGFYTAPAALPSANPVSIKASSVADPMASATASVTVRYPIPQVQWFSPGKVPLGPATFIVNGTKFYSGAVVMLNGVALPTTYLSSIQLRASSNVNQSSSGNITVANPGPAGAVSSPRLVEFGLGIVVSITPASPTVAAGAQQQFVANVTGTSNTEVYWYVNGGSSAGTINSGGLYKAPNTAPASPVTIRAVCAVNSERSAAATVTVSGSQQPVAVSISPTSASVQVNTTRQFTATVTGTANTAVTWRVNNITGGNSTIGTISGAGLYTAPATVPAGAATVSAVSQADTAKQASAAVTVTPTTPAITVSISPTSASVQTGATRQFTGTVTGTGNMGITWRVNNAAGGNSTTGTISASGLYTAPLAVPAAAVTVTAASQADETKQASASVTIASAPVVAVSISPTSASVQTNAARQFTATVTGSANTTVTWNVNNIGGGDSTVGTITTTGLYTAPATVPAGTVTVAAVSQADPTKQASATVTVTAPPVIVTIAIAPGSASLAVGATQQFTASITGSPNTGVTWQVNNTTGGNSTVGIVSNAGLYTAPGAIPSGAVTVTAISQADVSKKASASINVIDLQAITVGRFLEQSTFGPTPQLTAHVKQVGIQAYLDEQFNTPESVYPNGVASSMNEMTDQFFFHKLNGQDQLRQRVIYALSEVIVVSRNKNYYPNMLIPWLQILSRHAFGNYKSLLKELTLDASMANFLDMANSTKPGVAGGANENYPRELMQLFSIGLYLLNQDGSQQLDGNGKPIPTYSQDDVRQLALAFTGWTFNRATGPPQTPNPNYYPGPMVPLPAYHDTSSKTILGQTLQANQPMQEDVDDAIEIIFSHPNVAPFIVTRLIRLLVTSNPSAGYVSRVAGVFNNNGQGVRGDMKAVITAILLDPEARSDTPSNDFGRLRTPVQHHVALLRVLGGIITQPSQIAYAYTNMGESVLDAPSVFGHYSPMFRVPKQSPPLFGPEFQIHGPGELVNRANPLWNWMSYYQTGIWDLQWLFSLGGNHTDCINAVDNLLLYGRMSAGMRQQLLTALQVSQTAGGDAKMRALTVLYLTAMSSEYLVSH
ncbi:MAG: DUF1800 family protein [Acidobacteriota bacterium]